MRGELKNKDMGLVLRATAFAALKHRDQRRKDAEASPYINHPIALADLLWDLGGVRDPVVIAAGAAPRYDRGYRDIRDRTATCVWGKGCRNRGRGDG
jgi:hypothetical protein